MKFTIYSKNGCPYCDKIKQVMELSKFSHVVYTLDEDFIRDAFWQQFGVGATFPQVVMQNEQGILNLGGCTETVKYLQENKMI